MDIRQIKTFISVANHLNFTKASEEMYMTQPSISKIIKSLEDELDTQLFYRTPSVRLTDAGKELYAQSINLIALLENIPLEIQNLTNLNKGEIRIGIPPIMGSSFFPRVIGEFKALYPNIQIKLLEAGSKVIEEKLEKGEIEIGVICSYPEDKESYNMFKYVKSPLMVGVNIKNPLADRTIIKFKELSSESFILFQEDFSLYDLIIGRCMDNGFEPNIICNSSQRDFIVEMVASNLGITFLPEITSSTINRTDVKFIPLEVPNIYLNLLVVWRKDRYISYASREWLRFATQNH